MGGREGDRSRAAPDISMWTTQGMAESATEEIAFSNPPTSGKEFLPEIPIDAHEQRQQRIHIEAAAADRTRALPFTFLSSFRG